jgi:ribosomal protein S18 acetylase RimI-like enzyme
MPNEFSLRQVTREDFPSIRELLEHKEYLHRHLDWRTPTDWLGSQPFTLLEKDGKPQAALAFPEDPPGVAWIRLFVIVPGMRPSQTWRLLFQQGLETCSLANPPAIVSVATQGWYSDLLRQNDFSHHQDIVVLEWSSLAMPDAVAVPDITIYPMQFYDIETVAQVDQKSFETIWQNSADGLKAAFYQADYSTIVVHEGAIVGYQISSATPFSAHLARLAVLPAMQQRGIGRLLVNDMLRHFLKRGIRQITVNTQHNNRASLSIYKKTGFKLTGEHFPVFKYMK